MTRKKEKEWENSRKGWEYEARTRMEKGREGVNNRKGRLGVAVKGREKGRCMKYKKTAGGRGKDNEIEDEAMRGREKKGRERQGQGSEIEERRNRRMIQTTR